MQSKSQPVTLRQVKSAWVIVLPSELGAEIEDSLSPACGQALAAAPKMLVVDFSQVTFTNSAGIGALIDLVGRARERSVPVVLAGARGQPRIVLDRIGLARFVPLVATVEEAIDGVTP